ncbi:hypothetical protein H9P43_003061 [Blastocladiella emersonii ATCC 22665]|nr:hypothetical protein H9P43_003061 [Blastocladiella emersonii ATCC 22665]
MRLAEREAALAGDVASAEAARESAVCSLDALACENQIPEMLHDAMVRLVHSSYDEDPAASMRDRLEEMLTQRNDPIRALDDHGRRLADAINRAEIEGRPPLPDRPPAPRPPVAARRTGRRAREAEHLRKSIDLLDLERSDVQATVNEAVANGTLSWPLLDAVTRIVADDGGNKDAHALRVRYDELFNLVRAANAAGDIASVQVGTAALNLDLSRRNVAALRRNFDAPSFSGTADEELRELAGARTAINEAFVVPRLLQSMINSGLPLPGGITAADLEAALNVLGGAGQAMDVDADADEGGEGEQE